MELDCFGWEGSYRQRGKVDMPNDAVRLNYLTALADAGFESKLLISHDIALQHWQRKHGGHGWQHIPETVTQLMRYKGFDAKLIERILYTNPQEMLTIK
jgi:phosphotriesterase-related protein